MPGDHDPCLTAPLLPAGEKLLRAIDDNDSAGVSLDLQQLGTGLGDLNKEHARRSLAGLAGTEEGGYFELQAQLNHSPHVNAVAIAKSVVLASEMQVMLNGMILKHEYIDFELYIAHYLSEWWTFDKL